MCARVSIYLCVDHIPHSLVDTSDLVLAVQERSEEGPEVGTSKKIKKHHQLVGVAGRDHPLFLFRALGKILYCKSETYM